MNRNQLYALAEGTPFIPERLTKDNTVSLIYNPWKDSRVPSRFLKTNSLSNEAISYIEDNNLHGYVNIPVNQAAQILEQSKQFYRQ